MSHMYYIIGSIQMLAVGERYRLSSFNMAKVSDDYYISMHKLFFEYLQPSSNGEYSSIPQNIDHKKNSLATPYNCEMDNRVIIYDSYYSCIFGDVGPSKRYFSNDSLKDYLELETLEQCKLIKSAKLFNQKIVRLKTKLFYKQKKFNLLREESEGYTKLIVGFNNLPSLSETNDGINIFIKRIVSIIGIKAREINIGCFSLDPYRVLDLLIDYISFSPPSPKDSNEIIKYFKDYTGPSCLNEILSFKLGNSTICPPFLNLLVVLIKTKLIDLSFVYKYMLPQDQDLLLKIKLIEKNDEELAKRTACASLQESSKITRQPTLTYRFSDCPKMSLLSAFIRAGDIDSVNFFIQRFPPFLLVSFPDVIKSIFSILHAIIEPLYNKFVFCRYYRLNCRLIPKSDDIVFDFACKSFEDCNPLVFKLLHLISYNIYEDSILFTKLIRLFSHFIKDPLCYSNSEFFCGVIMTINNVFLPALTQMESNCVASEEIWHLIRIFPYNLRYKFYSHMKNSAYVSIQQLVRTKSIVTKNTKYICKRITKDTLKQCGRQLGKLSHSNPIIVLTEVMNQICSFDTMIIPIVECLKYLTPLSFDMLSYTLIEFLSVNSVSLTSKITSIPDVIQNLGTFASTVMRKYVVPLTGVLQYIANQMKDSNPLDLIVLREILNKMAGVEELHLSSQQIDFLAGSEILQEEAGVGFSSKSTRKYALRVRDALMECNLTFPLFFLMSQQRDRFIYDKSLADIHIKLTGQLYDQCHKTMVQYGRFISKYIPINDYIKHIPHSLSALRTEYGLNLECIFFLIRHIFRTEAINTPKNLSYIQAVNILLERYSESISEIISSKTPENIPYFYLQSYSLKLVSVFWLLDLYDIFLPKVKYDEYINKCNILISSIEDTKEIPSKKIKEKDRLMNVVRQLCQDKEGQKMHVAYIKQWIGGIVGEACVKNNKNDLLNFFFQFCVYPRSIFSPIDAIYSSEFVFVLHDIRSSNFNSLSFLDKVSISYKFQIFCENMHIISSFSESEAYNYGIFLNKIWEYLHPWHSSSIIFDQNCSKHPGFVIMSRNEQEKTEGYEYDNFRHLMYKWQYKQTKSFILCLESKDYIQIRNSIIILTRISSTFPRVVNLKNAIEKRIEKLVEEEKEKRPDLYALVTCYSAILRNLKDSILEEFQFHRKESSQKDDRHHKETETYRSNIQHIPVLMSNNRADDTAKSNHRVGECEEEDLHHSSTKLYEEHSKKNEIGSKYNTFMPESKHNLISEEYLKGEISERIYSLRNMERKRMTEENEDIVKSKRKKDIEDHEHRSAALNADKNPNEFSLNPKRNVYDYRLSSPTNLDKMGRKTRSGSSYSTKKKSHEDTPDYLKSKRDTKKRRA
ncbi:hypothetical protein HZS_1521 [Henneguya salminicola]|nr:hypothetical protein HZS_1521 [Henneguya salminicola]